MSDERELRIRAAFDLGRHAPSGLLREHGHQSGQQVVVALESDRITEVLDRLRPYDPPVMIAVYHPVKKAFAFLVVRPRHVHGKDAESHLDVDPNSSIGMLVECLGTMEQHHGTIRVTEWDEPVFVEDETPGFVDA